MQGNPAVFIFAPTSFVKHPFNWDDTMEPTPEQPTPAAAPAPTTAVEEQKKPKVLSVSQPQAEQPKLTKPRIITQIQSTPQSAIAATAQNQLAISAAQPSQISGSDPRSDAEWAGQTLSQAERDAEEQRMANDIAQSFPTAPSSSAGQQTEKPQDGQATPKTEPKSVHGVLYAIKGLADSITRKIAGK